MFKTFNMFKTFKMFKNLKQLSCKKQRKTSEMFCIRKHFRGLPINLRSQIIFKNLSKIIN